MKSFEVGISCIFLMYSFFVILVNILYIEYRFIYKIYMSLRKPIAFWSRIFCFLLFMGVFPLPLASESLERFPENALPAPASSGYSVAFALARELRVPVSLSFPPPVGTPRKPAFQTDVPAVVVRVIDGDSLVVNVPSFPPVVGHEISVRIAGCDTPELRDPRPEVRELAQRARALTAELAPAGSRVWLRDIRRDKYFRLLARVRTDSGDIREALLRQGLAVPYDGGRKTAW